jgi:hypothetical protein
VFNPFEDFKEFLSKARTLPLDRLSAAHDQIMAELTSEHNRVIEAYKTATEVIKDLSYDAQSIEDFCYVLDSGVDIPYLISGPAGIYVAALCNHVAEEKIVLRLGEMKRTLHFLGYRLPYGKSLRIEGDTGNFTGSALQGGDITVTGATGDIRIAAAIPANGCRVERFGLVAASGDSAA